MANQNISSNQAYFGLYTCCAGSMLAIPPSERIKIPFLIKNTVGSVPFIGAFTFGEQGFLAGKNFHGNLGNSMILISE